ncbi:two-component sensor histidine kinase [Micromonospora qiuiae]|uniref:histidine kinase n=1 Tax=Micromonospora qiuiae TaxID=502268 RepID=A0ABQ4J4H1_9ACTN|nr:histidine kinase [Micromonospora qiuiae]GIJ25054.1 two-component sensor histidine kinase [Micromonospora qiuiae]
MRGRLSRRPLHSVVFDVAVSGMVVLFGLASAVAAPGGWWSSAMGVAMALALLFRRSRPVAVTAVVGVLAFVQVLLGWGPLAYDVAVLIALYGVVKYADRLLAGVLAGILAAIGVVLAALQSPAQGPWYHTAIYYGLVTGAVWLAALNVRTRRLYVLSLEERAATLEREREAEARAAVAEERTRIARELHDVVAHSMAVMIVQADGARYMIDKSPETARNAVRVVADTGRQALADMRRLVGVLREPGPPEPESEPRTPDPAGAPVGPAPEPSHRRPTVAELPALLDRFRDAGLQVGYTMSGSTVPLPTALELTVYRLVQEALTNALKHAGVGAGVEVTLTHGADAVELRVVDDGRGGGPVAAAPPGGHGLVGMRERVSVYGGSLTAGPRLAGGWQVHARLPLPSLPETEVIAA